MSTEPYENSQDIPDTNWKTTDKSSWKIGITITHNLVQTPITKGRIAGNARLANLKVGQQGSNFKATRAQYLALLGMVKPKKYWLYTPGENANMWDEFYQKGIMSLQWDELGDLSTY